MEKIKRSITPSDENGLEHGYHEVYKGTYIHGEECGYFEQYYAHSYLLIKEYFIR